jgi:hypothetical protein
MSEQEKKFVKHAQIQLNRNGVVALIALAVSVVSIISSVASVSVANKALKRAAEYKTVVIKDEETEPQKYTDEELETVARVVYSEAKGEGYKGQALVAQCILNTAEATGQSPKDVALEPGQYAEPSKELNADALGAVKAVFLEGYRVTDEPIRYFYSPANTYSQWHELCLDYVLTYGGHKFFKER